jgi:hypothetical protein
VEQSVRTFEYRQPRMTTHFAVEFFVDGETYCGMCTDVSDGGVRATFERPVLIGSLGKLFLLHPERHFELEAVVAHLEGDDAGLTFACRTSDDRRICQRFVEMAIGLQNVT